jgi:hypothetical protein
MIRINFCDNIIPGSTMYVASDVRIGRTYATLPEQPIYGIPAGILADYIEEYVYISREPGVGAPPADDADIQLAWLDSVLARLRADPTRPCVVTLDEYRT